MNRVHVTEMLIASDGSFFNLILGGTIIQLRCL